MKTGKKRVLGVMVAGFLILMATASVQISLQLHQESVDQALIQAVKKLDAPAVECLLNEGASANARDGRDPPITFSTLLPRLLGRLQHKPDGVPYAERKRVLLLLLGSLADSQSQAVPDGIAVVLIHHGAEVDMRDEHQQTTLHMAVRLRLHQTVRLLLSRGIDVNARDGDGFTPLMFADAESTELLLDHAAAVNATSHALTPLLSALSIGDFKKAQILIQHGAEVNPTDQYGLSTLYHVQVHSRLGPVRTATIRFLKDHGARLNMNDREALAKDRKEAP